MNPKAEATMQRYLAEIEKAGRAVLVQHEAAKRDARLALIDGMISALTPAPTGHGFAGGLQVFGDLGTSRHWRHLRAKSLRTARKQQLLGRGDCAWFWLRKAAEQRKSEKRWKACERSPFHAQLMASVEPVQMQAAE